MKHTCQQNPSNKSNPHSDYGTIRSLKRIIPAFLLSGMFVMLASFTLPYNETVIEAASEESVQEADSVVDVIAWFDKNESMTYWIHESEWRFSGGDTTHILGAATKVMITVTDSTKNSYDMEYRFLETKLNPEADSPVQQEMKRLIGQVQEKLAGTTIRFRTDEFGHIEKYYNLAEVKKQAKQLVYEMIDGMTFADSLSPQQCVEIASAIKESVNGDMLVQGYIEELELLFQFHGNRYPVGEWATHDNATDTEYASDTSVSIWLDPESSQYDIFVNVDNYIPKEDLKILVGSLAEEILGKKEAKDLKESMDTELDEAIHENAVYTTSVYEKYFPDGWPVMLIQHTGTSIGDSGKLKQKYITWDSFTDSSGECTYNEAE